MYVRTGPDTQRAQAAPPRLTANTPNTAAPGPSLCLQTLTPLHPPLPPLRPPLIHREVGRLNPYHGEDLGFAADAFHGPCSRPPAPKGQGHPPPRDGRAAGCFEEFQKQDFRLCITARPRMGGHHAVGCCDRGVDPLWGSGLASCARARARRPRRCVRLRGKVFGIRLDTRATTGTSGDGEPSADF